MSQRYSLLTQITPANARGPGTEVGVPGADGSTTTRPRRSWWTESCTRRRATTCVALDASTGKIFWIFPYAPASDAKFCCGRITRGLAIHRDTLFLATVDANLIAIDAKSGRPLWRKVVAPATAGYSMTLAPLVIKDKVIVGTAGGEFGIRGFIAAYEVATGEQAWTLQHRAATRGIRARHVGRGMEVRRCIDLGDRVLRS